VRFASSKDLFLFTLSRFLCSLKAALSFFKDFFTLGEDLWTWTTRTGELYEDVELLRIEADEVVIRHKFGECSLAINDLSRKTRERLSRTQAWRAASFSRVAAKAGSPASVHAEAA
jgi:hypothetical protein